MVHLIDIFLVGAVVGAALYAFVKYFVNLGKADDEHSAPCTGCASCDDSVSSLIK